MRGSRKHRRDTTGASRRTGGRSVPLVTLLARLTWKRDPEVWTVHCRDGWGRRTTLQIGLTTTGIAITGTGSGPWQLTLLESGRLRGACSAAHPGPGFRHRTGQPRSADSSTQDPDPPASRWAGPETRARPAHWATTPAPPAAGSAGRRIGGIPNRHPAGPIMTS